MKDEQHVHDCTGPDATCPCGYRFRVPRFAFSVEVYDNQTKQQVVDEGFNCDDVGAVIDALESVVDVLEGR